MIRASTPAHPTSLARISKLSGNELIPRDYAQSSYIARPPAGTIIKDLLNKAFWQPVANRIRLFDQVEVIPVDGAFYARLLLVHVDGEGAEAHLLEQHELLKQRTQPK